MKQWSEWFQSVSSPQSLSLSTFSPHFTHFLSETYSDSASGPFSLGPMGFSYSVYLPHDGFNLQQTRTLTRSTIQWVRKVLTCMFAPTQNPPWRGGWQKKKTLLWHKWGQEKCHGNGHKGTRMLQHTESTVLFYKVYVSYTYVRNRGPMIPKELFLVEGSGVTWHDKQDMSCQEKMLCSLFHICYPCILTLFVFFLPFPYIWSQSLYV